MRLYPEDIAVFYDLIPIGTKVTVVNQPYVFGWRNGALYLQAYAVMEDDSRDWDKNRKRLLAKLLSPSTRQKIGQKIEGQDDQVDWQRVADLAHAPRAVPVPVTGGQDGLDTVLAQSLLVQNTLPEGSNWDGETGLLVDEKTFNDLVSGKNQAPPPSGSAPSGSTPSGTAAPTGTGAPKSRSPAPRTSPGGGASTSQSVPDSAAGPAPSGSPRAGTQ
jgi:L,D-transpeptidase ErfK/SrfK